MGRSALAGRFGCALGGGVFGRSFGIGGRAEGGLSVRSLFGRSGGRFGCALFGCGALLGRPSFAGRLFC